MRKPDKKPRAAYCTGCGVVYDKMHLMINHRRLHRCGGRFLPQEEAQLILGHKYGMQDWEKFGDAEMYRIAYRQLVRASVLRRGRLTREQATRAAAR